MKKEMLKTFLFLLFVPVALKAQTEPYRGGIADGNAMHSMINFSPNAYINKFKPFSGGIADGAARDSVITFNPLAYITKYTPFSGGIADGYGNSNIVVYSTPLSTSIFDFYGRQQEGRHYLYWKTGSEADLASYEIQRSKDLQQFGTIGRIPSNGMAGANAWNWIDEEPMQGKNYYRIKINRKSGDAGYSAIVLLIQDDKRSLAIYPSPAQNVLYITMPDLKEYMTAYTLMDNTGKVIRQSGDEIVSGKLAIDLSGLNAGIYYLNMNWDGHVQSFKVVKMQ